MTKKLEYQVEVFNKEQALKHFKDSNYETHVRHLYGLPNDVRRCWL